MTLVILLVLVLSLFAIAFVTKRRFGVLGLGLTAGLVLSQVLTKDTAGFLRYFDFPIGSLTYEAAGSALLILAPALVLLVSGPKYSDRRLAIAGSALFAVFGVVLLLTPLAPILITADPSVQPMMSAIALNNPTIISAGVIAAVVDMMHAQGKTSFGKKAKH
jgi:hypothetical protein